MTLKFFICSSSSSSPLLSLVTSTSEISHQPVHTNTTYIWQRGRQNRKTGNGRKIQHYMRRGRRRKKNLPPDYAPFGEYSVRTEKNTSAQKHIYHKHITLQQGDISSSGKQPSGPVPFISAPVADPLWQPGGTKWPEAVGRGRGVMSVIGGGEQESPAAALFPG